MTSKENKGSSFSVNLQEYDENVQKDNQVKTESPQKGNGTILVIDDEESLRLLYKRLLDHCGYNVLLADNGTEGIKAYEDNKEKINVVILDLGMPNLSGREVFSELQKSNQDVRVIISSGYSEDKRVQEMLDLGAKGFVPKPFTLSSLSQAVVDAQR